MQYGNDISDGLPVAEVALLDCSRTASNSHSNIGIRAVEFFDDENLIAIYQNRDQEKGECYIILAPCVLILGPVATYIGMLRYIDLRYQSLDIDETARCLSREDLVHRILKMWHEGHVCDVHHPRRIFSNPLTSTSLALDHLYDYSHQGMPGINGRPRRGCFACSERSDWQKGGMRARQQRVDNGDS